MGGKTCLELGIGHGKTTELFSGLFEKYVVLEGDKNIIDRFKRTHTKIKAEIVETYFEKCRTELVLESQKKRDLLKTSYNGTDD